MKRLIVWLVAVSALTMPVLAKRAMPRNVEPAVGGGVRYEASHRLPRVGLIEAWDEQSGKKLWEQKVYEVKIDPNLEEDVQWDFISRLRLQGNELLITTESGKAYTLDVTTRKVTEIRPVLQLQDERKNPLKIPYKPSFERIQ